MCGETLLIRIAPFPNLHLGRTRSSSYSPFLAAKEVRSNSSVPTRPSDGVQQAELSASAQDSLPQGKTQQPTSEDVEIRKAENAPVRETKSFSRARKEAQEAVLRLWPLGVKYQDYIDEGFDEKVIKDIFGQLHLNIPKEAGTVDTPEASLSVPEQALPPVPKPQPSPTAEKQQHQQAVGSVVPTGDKSSAKPEARNERIARLLAEQQAKKAATAASVASQPAPIQTKPKEISTPTPPIKPKAMSNKPSCFSRRWLP